MLHSISDLTTFCRKTTGDVPAKLVGASTTVVGSKMYLFGGRLVAERRMVADLYSFDLETFAWERLPTHPDDDVPRARYFHSADAWNNQLIIFGGMSNKTDSANPDDLCVLNDVRFFDLFTQRWLPGAQSNVLVSDPVSESLVPRARYAHLSSTTADRLFIIGGQDFFNVWLDDVCVYDLLGKAWVQRREYPRHCGTYRSVAVSASLRVRLPQEELRGQDDPAGLGPPGSRFREDREKSTTDTTSPDSHIHLPYSAAPSEDFPSDIYLYSNYNFTDVKRELEVFSPLPDTDFTIHDRSAAMQGTSFPPGLRFPTGAILGTHFIIAGTYLAHTYQSFSIWALDLVAMTWSRIDPGSAVATGSWFRGCLWAEANKFLVFGNRNGNLVDDYNRRLLSWDHVAVVDLEAFGIYQPPPLQIDTPMQELGLAALEESAVTDFAIICDDGRKVNCSRRMLEVRWPWFKQQRQRFLQAAMTTLESLPTSSMHVPLPPVPGVSDPTEGRVDPRLTPRSFNLSEPYPVTLALLQYFYSFGLITPLQHAPAVLSQLLVLSNTYEITHLEGLVKHAMHRALSNSTSVGVYEVATLCSSRSLQIRALKTVMSYSQKKPSRSRGDKDGGAGGPPDQNGHSNSSTGRSNGTSESITRPRGTSDASHWQGNNSSSGSSRANNLTIDPFGSPGRDQYRSPILTSVGEGSDAFASHFYRPPPNARSSKADHRQSTLSMLTENEIHAVADLMLALPTTPPRPDRRSNTYPESPGEADPILGDINTALETYFQRDIDASESEYIDDGNDELNFDSYDSDRHDSYLRHNDTQYRRPRRPQVMTRASSGAISSSGSARSVAPSLTSSTSTSSLYSSSPSSSFQSSRHRYSPLTAVPPTSNLPHPPLDDLAESVYDGYRSRPTSSISPPAYDHMEYSPSSDKNKTPLIYRRPRSSHSSEANTITHQPTTTTPPLSPPLPYPSSLPVSSGFARFLSSKKDKSASPGKDGSVDAKAAKALEKQRKKAESKARTEALAYDLKQRAKARAAAADKTSMNSQERRLANGEVTVMWAATGVTL